MRMRVRRVEPVLVHAAGDAAATAPDDYYFLSNLDQNVVVLIKTLHVYSASSDYPDDNAATVIMSALARVLVHYYPFQGSLVVNAHDGRLSVQNDHRGVPVVVADADCELKELGDVLLSTPNCELKGELVFVGPSNSGEKKVDDDMSSGLGAPLLTVQVTRFRCGGFMLGLAMNHCLADDVAAADFLCSWAKMARSVPLSSPPSLDHIVLRARTSLTVDFPHEEFAEMEDVSGLAGLLDEPHVLRAFAIDHARLARLKRQACAHSTFVALTAFVWRTMRMRPDQKSKLMFVVDGKRRVDPPLSRGFCGNTVIFACCVSTAGKLLGRPVSVAAWWIQDAIRRTDHAVIRSAIDYVEVAGGRGRALVTAWNYLGFHTADFGWGEAAQCGPVELPCGEVVMFMRNVHDSSIVLLLGLPQSCMQEFKDMVNSL